MDLKRSHQDFSDVYKFGINVRGLTEHIALNIGIHFLTVPQCSMKLINSAI